MSEGKTFAQLRADIIKDIDDIRAGRMSSAVASGIFQGVKELTGTINAEIAAARLCLLTEGRAHEFGKVVKLGQRKVSGEA